MIYGGSHFKTLPVSTGLENAPQNKIQMENLNILSKFSEYKKYKNSQRNKNLFSVVSTFVREILPY